MQRPWGGSVLGLFWELAQQLSYHHLLSVRFLGSQVWEGNWGTQHTLEINKWSNRRSSTEQRKKMNCNSASTTLDRNSGMCISRKKVRHLSETSRLFFSSSGLTQKGWDCGQRGTPQLRQNPEGIKGWRLPTDGTNLVARQSTSLKGKWISLMSLPWTWYHSL